MGSYKLNWTDTDSTSYIQLVKNVQLGHTSLQRWRLIVFETTIKQTST